MAGGNEFNHNTTRRRRTGMTRAFPRASSVVALLGALLGLGGSATSSSSSSSTSSAAVILGGGRHLLRGGGLSTSSSTPPLSSMAQCLDLVDGIVRQQQQQQQQDDKASFLPEAFCQAWVATQPAHSLLASSRRRRLVAVAAPCISDGFAAFDDQSSWLALLVALFCVLGAALASGLTIGLISLEPLQLEINQRVGSPEEQEQAKAVLPVLKRRHLLLVTLLLFNAAAAEALPVFLDELVPSYVSVVISVTLVLICGEIIPVAVFSGPNQLKLAAQMMPLVWTLMVLFFPLACPISWCLDKLLGDEHAQSKRYSRLELSALVALHGRRAGVEGSSLRSLLHLDGVDDQQQPPSGEGMPPSLPATPITSRSISMVQEEEDVEAGGGAAPTALMADEPDYRVLQRRPRADSEGLLVESMSQHHSSSRHNLQQQSSEGEEEDKESAPKPKMKRSTTLPTFMKKDSHGAAKKNPLPPSHQLAKASSATLLTKREVDMTLGVLALATKRVVDYMVPWDQVFCCPADMRLNEANLAVIRKAGYSRIPIYRPGSGQARKEEEEKDKKQEEDKDPQSVCGFVLMTQLLGNRHLTQERAVESLGLRCPVLVAPDCPLMDLLCTFQLGRSHLALVSRRPDEALARLMNGQPLSGPALAPMGIITLRNVLEAMLQADLLDEKDHHRRQAEEGSWLSQQQQQQQQHASGVGVGVH